MEWNIQIGSVNQRVRLPDSMPDNSEFDLTINDRVLKGKWQRATRTLFLMDPARPGVWMPLFTRTKTTTRFPGESDVVTTIEFTPPGSTHPLCYDSTVSLHIPGQEGRDGATIKKPKVVRSQMTGKVLKILVKAGDSVASGDPLLIVEAMKMENRVLAVSAGVVDTVKVTEGETISSGKELIRLK